MYPGNNSRKKITFVYIRLVIKFSKKRLGIVSGTARLTFSVYGDQPGYIPEMMPLNLWEKLRGQTMHFVHSKRILEQSKIRFVAESTTLSFFFILLAVLDSTNK